MTYGQAILLGFVQGVAEFLPISSSGHLAVLQNFLAIGDMENHLPVSYTHLDVYKRQPEYAAR